MICRYSQILFVTLLALPFAAPAENLQAPRFISQPASPSSIVSEGRTKILQCQAQGNPRLEFRWLKDGHPLTDFLPEHFYKIQSLRREDAGNYSCIARNEVGAIFSNKFDVSVAYMGQFEDVEEKTQVVQYGSAAILDLPLIESHPLPSVTWQTEDAPVPYDRKYVVTLKNQLVILAADEEDEKSYRVRATNTQLGKEENSGFIRLAVDKDSAKGYLDENEDNDQPAIIIGPSDLRIIKGQSSADLECVANSRYLHELSTIWLKDGIPLENAGIQFSLNDVWNRTLSLLNIEPGHGGQYVCKAMLRSNRGNQPIEVEASATISVLEKPIFTGNLRPEFYSDFASSVNLPCHAIGVPTPQIVWYRNTEPLSMQIGSRFEVQDDGSLMIKSVAVEDAGMFQCLAKNEAGEVSMYTWLRVKTSAPTLTMPPTNVTVLAGKDATINCRAKGAPAPTTTWKLKDGETLRGTQDRFSVLESGDILISSVQSADAGEYTCIQSNEAGRNESSAWLIVLVQPQILQPPADTKIILGHTATFQCKVSSDHSLPFSITWKKNGLPIDTSRTSRIQQTPNGTLEIKEVRAGDVGEYTCFLNTSGGNDFRSAKLMVIELPYAPGAVAAYKIEGTKKVNVSWTPGFDGNSPILKYIVQKREVQNNELLPLTHHSWTTELTNISATARWVVLPFLKAAASYQFRVSAINSVGEGNPSDPSGIVALPQERPSGPPQGLVGSARSASEIIIQWQPPVEKHHNGILMGYLIRYRLYGYIDSPWSYRNVTNEAQRNYLIQELITWKDYEIQVAAYNDKGVGVYSDSIKIKTKEGVPEDAPSKVRATALNSTAVQVWWTPPDPQKINGINQGYKLQAWKSELFLKFCWLYNYLKFITDTISDTSEHIIKTVPPNLLDPLAEQMTVLENLDKYALYQITVLCFTDPGDGDKSEPIQVHTLEDVPGPVAKFQFDEVSDRAVTVSWGTPPNPNGILIGYTLKYMVKDKAETEKVLELHDNTTSLRIEGLQATTHYRFEIKAQTAVGLGEASSATIQSGIEPVLPTAPTHLAVTNIEAFSVMLQFTPGFDGNSSIIKWIVEGQTSRATTWSVLQEVSDPDAMTIFVKTLLPFMQYKLRLTAVNVVGASPPSEPTKDFQTIQAPPKHSPKNVTVRAVSATELRVRWIPLHQLEWFGNPRGYNITCFTLDGIAKIFIIEDHTANSYVLSHLEEFTEYSVQMSAFNDVGASGLSPPARERTREAAPSSGPNHVEANATSSTTIVVKWGDIPKGNENGIIDGYKVFYGAPKVPFKHKVIPKNTTHTTTLTELKKYVSYHIQVLAYTRLGDGVLSMPPVAVKTFEDTPGPPSNVSFPDVSFSTARIIWDVPEDPNGEILAYRVSYHLEENISFNYSREFPPSDRTFRATELEPEQYYLFSVRAQTRLGWGKTAQALVYTTNNREPPEAPSMPQISRSQVQSEQIIFSWTPGRDGFAPLRYYTVQKAEGADGPWLTVGERVDPQLTYYTVTELKPFTAYKFRIQSTNDLGPSGWSPPSALFKTLPAAPSQAVKNLKVVPITTTSVRVQWEPISDTFWSGDRQTGGYKITYQQFSHYPTAMQASPSIQVPGVSTKEAILDDLLRDNTYEIIVIPYNSQGLGPASTPATVYVGEAVPTGKPRDITAEAVSPTEVHLSWKPPPQGQQNGELLGYKIYYVVTDQPALENTKDYKKPVGAEQELEVVAAPSTSHSLVFLDQYTTYQINIVAFNPAGDGPPSSPVTVTTLEGLPGPPANLTFVDITMTSLLVTWDPPVNRNGKIMGYVVSYETAENDERYTKQVKQKVSDATFLLIQGLEEEVMYTFTVRALTFEYGPAATANVTTGPQDGSPVSVRELSLTRTLASVELSWVNGVFVKQPILGYYIESQRKDDVRWQIVAKTKGGPSREFSVSYQNLLPSTSYKFRVIAYNKFGVSYPTYSKENVITPSKLYLEYGYLQLKPFYRQSWFMVVLAAMSVIIIVAVIAVLCVKSKSYKYKQEAQNNFEKSIKADGDDINDPSMEMSTDVPYQAYSQSLLGSTRGRNRASAVFGKTPPRPRPASVAYNSDDDSVKGYDENPDDSSVTEKPSELSSTDSQETESDNDSEGTPPPSFVNHYANINDSLRQSWKRQKPIRNYSSYTDSEPEPYISTQPRGSDYEAASSSAAASILNGGQIVMNNKARSRAPLPGFSSFV
ncbi:protein sidekick [Neocloeon triangulifer]|uniref:protein sidekick n=1 Tax=Neocloeon triangulifer TaxID=2078957 RepID=UPI00286EDF60|nr:protein sidekick [Neocloeon triangulifer]